MAELGRRCLREAIAAAQTRHPFEIVAIVLIPGHCHTIWTLLQSPSLPALWRRLFSCNTQMATTLNKRFAEIRSSDSGVPALAVVFIDQEWKRPRRLVWHPLRNYAILVCRRSPA